LVFVLCLLATTSSNGHPDAIFEAKTVAAIWLWAARLDKKITIEQVNKALHQVSAKIADLVLVGNDPLVGDS
jgi:hypothetical protein